MGQNAGLRVCGGGHGWAWPWGQKGLLIRALPLAYKSTLVWEQVKYVGRRLSSLLRPLPEDGSGHRPTPLSWKEVPAL